jgi:hypothetical protein
VAGEGVDEFAVGVTVKLVKLAGRRQACSEARCIMGSVGSEGNLSAASCGGSSVERDPAGSAGCALKDRHPGLGLADVAVEQLEVRAAVLPGLG